MESLLRIPRVREVLLMLILLHVQSIKSDRSYRSNRKYSGSWGSEIGIEIGIFIAGCILSGICWCCKDSCRYPCPRRRVKRTRNVISIPPPIVERAVNPNVTYTTKEDNIAHIPAVDPPKYETVVTDGSADSTGPYYGQPPPYPSTAGTDIHEQNDDHVTHDTAKLVKE